MDGTSYNNYKRESSVYLKLNDVVAAPSNVDKSRQTIEELNLCGNFPKKVNLPATVYYTSIKRKLSNAYGQIESVNYMSTGDGIQSLSSTKKDIIGSNEKIYNSNNIFGGDTYITRMSIKRSHNYFSQFLHDVPDGFIYDYRTFRNVAYPRYWMDSFPKPYTI